MPNEYEVVVYYAASRRIKIKANNREEAIEKASKRCKVLGIEPTALRVPFIEGDNDAT